MFFRSPVHAGSAILVALAAITASCGHPRARAVVPSAPARIGMTETGIASWYGIPYHGRQTASGEVYDMYKLTAARRNLPFQTWVQVENLSNGKRVEVRITDRGPFVANRIIDLSQLAADRIGMLRPGTARVRLTVIARPKILPSETSQPEISSCPSSCVFRSLRAATGRKNFAAHRERTARARRNQSFRHFAGRFGPSAALRRSVRSLRRPRARGSSARKNDRGLLRCTNVPRHNA